MLLLFWDCDGLILEHYSEQGTTVKAPSYAKILKSKLKLVIRKKHRHFLTKGVLLLHSMCLLILSQLLLKQLGSWKFNFSYTPPYIPDLAPLDYQMFGPLTEALCGQRFAHDDEVKDVMHTWLWLQLKTFFADRIRTLVSCYTTCWKNMINLRNDTLCICHRLFYTKQLINPSDSAS
jgi:hypothetical protein